MSGLIESVAMPDFVHATRLFRHTVWSATASLLHLGVPLRRVMIEYDGGGWAPDTVVRQHPAPGHPLGPGKSVVLGIAGTGTLESLPFSLRAGAAPDEFGEDRFCDIIDATLSRARCFVREGADYFKLSPEVPNTALRWITEIMQADETPWLEQEWYRVATFFSSLHRLAGRHDAIAVALRFVYGLDVARIELVPSRLPIDAGAGTRLGVRGGRLGIDAIAGDGVIVLHGIRVTIGPVSLDNYIRQAHRTASRQAIYRLVVPAFLPGAIEERWVVDRLDEGYRLGSAEAPAMLGVSSYLEEGDALLTSARETRG